MEDDGDVVDGSDDIYFSTNMYNMYSSTAGTDFESFCAPIGVPNNDPFFGGRKSCMNLVRFENILKHEKQSDMPGICCIVHCQKLENILKLWQVDKNIVSKHGGKHLICEVQN